MLLYVLICIGISVAMMARWVVRTIRYDAQHPEWMD